MAVEHAMFKFDDLKVTSRDDRMTTKVLSSRPRIKCGETNNVDKKVRSEMHVQCTISWNDYVAHTKRIFQVGYAFWLI